MEHDTKHTWGGYGVIQASTFFRILFLFKKEVKKSNIERDQRTHVNLVHATHCYASNVNPSGVFLTFPSYDKLNAHVVDIELLGFQLCRWMCPYSNPIQPNPTKKGQKLSWVENKGTQR